MDQLRKPYNRDDYRELLELLAVIFLGGTRGISFQYPGAMHHTRWMSKPKAIYSLKIFIFRKQFKF